MVDQVFPLKSSPFPPLRLTPEYYEYAGTVKGELVGNRTIYVEHLKPYKELQVDYYEIVQTLNNGPEEYFQGKGSTHCAFTTFVPTILNAQCSLVVDGMYNEGCYQDNQPQSTPRQ